MIDKVGKCCLIRATNHH